MNNLIVFEDGRYQFAKFTLENDELFAREMSRFSDVFGFSNPQFFLNNFNECMIIERIADNSGFRWKMNGAVFSSEVDRLEVDDVVLTMPPVLMRKNVLLISGIARVTLGDVSSEMKLFNCDVKTSHYRNARTYVVFDSEALVAPASDAQSVKLVRTSHFTPNVLKLALVGSVVGLFAGYFDGKSK